MADRHLNLFYTYNRDSELIENNLTRAFIMFLSVVSGETRHKILSALLQTSRKTTKYSANMQELNFTVARFALQSNIDRHIPKGLNRKLLLTIATEPLDIASSTNVAGVESADEDENDSGFSSVPDAWIYDETRDYCILIEAKVGAYPLTVGQLQAHARDWFGFGLQELDSRGSLCSITWIDVLRTLRDALNSDLYLHPSEETLLSHMMGFISNYGYRLFEGFDFSGLDTPPDLVFGNPHSPENDIHDFDFRRLAAPPDFLFSHPSPGP